MSDVDPQPDTDPVTATTPPVGVSSQQIFYVAIIILGLYALAGVMALWKGDPAERTAWEQSSISLAILAAGFYLGSSASSRNKDRPGN